MNEFKPKTQTLRTNPPNSQSVPDDNLREIIKSRVKTFNPYRRDRIIEWNINISYLCGHQYIGLLGNQLVPRKEISPFATTVNKIAPAVRNDVALATKMPPIFDVVPETTDEDDRATAIAGEKMLSYLRRVNNFDEQRGKLILWYDIAGISWRKQYWDPFCKVIGTNQEPEEEGHDPNMKPGDPIYQGEAVSRHTPTNELIWDWRLPSDRLPWIIHAIPMTKHELRVRYGDKVDEIPESEFTEPNSTNSEFEIKIFNEFKTIADEVENSGKIKPEFEQSGNEDKIIIAYELWHIQDRVYPSGIYGVMAGLENGVVLVNSPYPKEQYPHGQIPFVAYEMLLPHIAVSGTASRISQARPLQNELNEIRTLIRENTATLGSGMWSVPREAKLNIKRIRGGPGLIVEYDGPYKPTREAGVPVSGQLFVYAREIVEDISDIFSFPIVAQGKHPTGGPKSGVGIALLQEAGQTQHSPIIREMEKQDEVAVNQLLSIAFANYGNRLLPIVGKDNEWTLYEYDPNSFNGKMNVIVQSGSSTPISRAVEQERTLGLLQMGLLGDPFDPSVRKRVLEVLDIGGIDKILKDNNKDVNFAKKEFLVPAKQYQMMIQQGVPNAVDQIYFPNVNSFDNHEVHIIEHKNEIIDKYFEYLGSGDPGMMVIANAMLEHWNRHAIILNQMRLQQALLSGQVKPPKEESAKTDK